MAARLKNLPYWIAFIFLLALAFGLRVSSAQNRPLHADEGVQAYTTAKLQETGAYQYTAEDRHGPTLYYFASGLNKLRGVKSQDITDFDLRLLPLLFSIATLLLLKPVFGKNWKATAFATAILATTPLSVIYGAYFIQEAIFVFLTILIAVFGYRLLFAPSISRAIILGVSIGLMQATKETSILVYGAVGLSLAASFFISKKGTEEHRAGSKPSRPYLISLGIAVLAFITFQSSFFSDFGAVWNSITAYFNYFDRAGGQGHEKPFGYYLSIFLSQRSIGLAWGEIPLLILLFIGSLGSLWHAIKHSESTMGSFCGLSGIILALTYSLIPYKTPWLMLAPITLASISAAEWTAGRLNLIQPRNFRAAVTAIALLALVALELKPALLATGRYATHEKNPYIYSHTVGQYSKLQDRISELATLRPELSIAVISPDNAWPLPWDLRHRENVGYWTTWIDKAADLDLALVDSRIESSDEIDLSLSQTHVPDIHGLRPNTLLTVYIRKEIWNQYLDTK